MIIEAIAKDGKIVFNNPRPLEKDLRLLEGKKLNIEIKIFKKTRTSLQNRSLHLWFTQLAEALNDAGYDMRKVIKGEFPITWTDYNVKEYLFRPVMNAHFGYKSTKQLKTADIDKIYMAIDKTIAERTGVHVDWPCLETMMNNNL